MNQRIQSALAMVAVVCAVTTTGLVVIRELRPAAAEATTSPLTVENVGELIASAPHVSGPPDAEVTVVEFFDFQCPACRMLAASMDSVVKSGEVNVRIARHHFPLTRAHPTAQDLALAGLCLTDPLQFDEYYHNAFEHQSVLASLEGTVGPMSVMPAGVDTTAIRACMKSPTTWAKLASELELAGTLRLRATPSLIIHGEILSGALGATELTRRLRNRK